MLGFAVRNEHPKLAFAGRSYDCIQACHICQALVTQRRHVRSFALLHHMPSRNGGRSPFDFELMYCCGWHSHRITFQVQESEHH